MVSDYVISACIPPETPALGTSDPTALIELQVSNGGELPTTSHMWGFRQELSAGGVSGDHADLIFLSWWTQTNSNYNLAWAQWCSSRAEDPFSASIALFLGFLTKQFTLQREYRSLNVCRSAVSSTHPLDDGFPLRQHPLLTRLLKGVFKASPPKSKYSSVWNVS